MLSIALIIPTNDYKSNVVHQHLIAKKDDPTKTGFKDGHLVSHLPIFVINTNREGIPGIDRESELRLACDYKIIDHEDGLNDSNDEGTMSGKLAISLRGNSSLYFPKKQYSIKLIDEDFEGEDKALLGMPKHSAWVLNGSYIDESLIRNYMLYNLSAEIMGYAPRVRLCEVLMHDKDGNIQYEGVYTLIEKPRVAQNRLDLNPYNPKHEETSFMLQLNSHVDKREVKHLKYDGAVRNPYDLEYPDALEITDESYDYITNQVFDFEKKIYDAKITNNFQKVEDLIDDSFIDYYIINEFFQNYDAGRRSTYIHKNIGGKFSMGPVWDFDGAFNNYIGLDMPISELKMRRQYYYYYLMHDQNFVNQVIKRYHELRRSFLSDKYLLDYIEKSTQYLGSAAERNATRWYEDGYRAYLDDVESMKKFVIERGAWMDENFVELITVVDWKGVTK